MSAENNQIRQYVKPSSVGGLLPLALGCGVGITGLFVDIAHPMLLLLFASGIGLLVSLPYFLSNSRISSVLQEHQRQGTLDVLESDFAASQSAFDGALRVGDAFLFGKKTGTIVSYDQIRKIYVYIHKTNGAEDRRALRIETADGKTHDLCNLPVQNLFHKGDHPDLMKVISLVVFKNPSVKVGYK